MKRVVNVLVLFGIAALIAAAIAWWLLRDTGPEGKGPEPTKSPVLTMKTKGVEKSISERLTARYGRQVVAECPDEVEQTVGTKFECEVYFKDDKDVRTVAKVKMTGGGGRFTWKTEDATPQDEGDEA